MPLPGQDNAANANNANATNWTSGNRSRAVQHAYVNARVKDINGRGLSKLAIPTLDALKLADPSLRKADRLKLQEVFLHMTERLQGAPLTINFVAWSWFENANGYESYTQMYERAVQDGNMVLTDKDAKNPAQLRAAADDRATMPSNWVDSSFRITGMTGGVYDKFDVKVPAGPQGGRGLKPGARGTGEIIKAMSPGPLVKQGNGQGANAKYTAANLQFDPRTKQVFAALNYGRRPHGACTDYGHSYLVLSDKFKRDALYFGGDTFGVFEGKAVTADDQISYDLLGAVFLKANAQLRADLLASCLRDGSLGDTKEKDCLLEAHLFEAVKFSGGATTMFISSRDAARDRDGNQRPFTGDDWQRVQTNARAFAAKHRLRLFFID